MRIEYSTFVPFDVRDVVIIEMSEAWSALRRLAVCEAEPVRRHGPPSCQVGVLGLRAIA